MKYKEIYSNDMFSIENTITEYCIPEKVADSIRDEITKIVSMNDVDVCEQFAVECKNELYVMILNEYYSDEYGSMLDYYDELEERNIVPFRPSDIVAEEEARIESEELSKQNKELADFVLNAISCEDWQKIPYSLILMWEKSENKRLIEVVSELKRYADFNDLDIRKS